MKKLIRGLWAMTAWAMIPLAYAEDAQGQWSGAIAGQLTVVLDVTRADNGSLQATLASPTQGFAAKAEQLVADGTNLSFSIPQLRGGYQASWHESAQAWVGIWTQGEPTPLTLKRTDAAAVEALKPRRPQETAIAAATAPYTSQEVKFASAASGPQLAGTLLLPMGAGPWPAVVLVHGSGRLNRDADIFGHKIFLVLADHLARRGIAVLRYDKRGVHGSSGNYAAATSLDFADDAQGAVAFLRTRPEIDIRHIGMIGHSEGGLIAPVVAARDPAVAFVVMMASPGVRGEVLLVEQMALGAEAQGVSAGKVMAQRALNRELFAAIAAEHAPEQARSKAMTILEQAERDGLLSAGTAPDKANQFSSPWFLQFLTLEPAVALRAMRQPVLALNGELDRQVPAKLDLDAIRIALANNPHAAIKELPKLNHLFQTAMTGTVDEYARIEETLAPSALDVITTWVRQQVQ